MIPKLNSTRRIVFFSNVNGNFDKLAEAYRKIKDKSGDFDLIILNGKVFSIDKPFSEVKSLDQLQTKILIFDSSEVGIVAKHQLGYEHYQLSDFLTLLGRSGVYVFSEKIRIAYLNGKEHKKYLSDDIRHKYTSCYFSRSDIDNLLEINKKSGVKNDMLLINTIPLAIFEEMKNDSSSPYNSTSLQISKDQIKSNASIAMNLVLKKISPRYVITSGEDFYFERKPYVNNENFLTRFIHLAHFPSNEKQNAREKFLYALSVKPVNEMINAELYEFGNGEYSSNIFKDVSEDLNTLFINKSKYSDKNIKITKEELYVGNLDRGSSYDDLYDFLKRFGNIEYLNMMYDSRNRFLGHAFVKFKNTALHDELIKQSSSHSLNGRKVIISEKIEKIRSLEDIEKSCWFCFNNPDIDADLILKTFNDFYLAYPKGPIDLFHFLIVPKRHIQSLTFLDDNMKKEYSNILSTVIQLIQDNQLEYLLYEKNLPYNNQSQKHMIINLIGIKKELAFSFLDEMNEVFSTHKVSYKEFDHKKNLSDLVEKNPNRFYYFMDAPTGIQFGRSSQRTKVIADVNQAVANKGFVDYPRMIVCNMNDKEDRINWKNCDLNKEFLVSLKDKVIKYFP